MARHPASSSRDVGDFIQCRLVSTVREIKAAIDHLPLEQAPQSTPPARLLPCGPGGAAIQAPQCQRVWPRLGALALWLVAFLSPIPGSISASTPGDQPLNWRLVAASHVILKCRLNVPKAATERTISAGEHRYFDIPVTEVEELKGRLDATAPKVSWFSEDYGDGEYVLIRQLEASAKEPVVLFLVRAPLWPGTGATTGLYFASASHFLGDSAPACLATPDMVAALKREISLQAEMVHDFPPFGGVTDRREIARVRNLIASLTLASKQFEALNQLEKLPPQDLPIVIALMDDHRQLAIQHLEVPSDGFELIAHASPREVVDLLAGVASVLAPIQEAMSCDLENGGSMEERVRTVAAWKIYWMRKTRGLPVRIGINHRQAQAMPR
jgi:hypothetical protein